MTDIATELARQLEVPVKVSPELKEEKVSVDVKGLNLEGLLRFFAGRQYVDYLVGGDDLGYPRVLAVYLYGINEEPPLLNETVKTGAYSFLVEGHTEEGTEEYEKRKKLDPLQIVFKNNRLSVIAEKQPLSVVVARVANEMGVPFDLRTDSNTLVDVNFKGYTIDQAMRALSPYVKLYYRLNLLDFEKSAIQIVLDGPAKTAD